MEKKKLTWEQVIDAMLREAKVEWKEIQRNKKAARPRRKEARQ